MTTQSAPYRPSRIWLDDLAELYDDFIGVLDQEDSPTRKWMLAHLPGGKRALDIGCGNGRNCRLVADRYEEVVGIDISPRVLEIASSKGNPPNVRYECFAIQDATPEALGVFDAVYASNAVFSMGPASSVLPSFRSLIAPGGRLVVLDPTRRNSGSSGEDQDETRQSFYPFEIAHAIYQLSKDADGAIAALRYMLHPTWAKMNEECSLLTTAEFEREYSAVFPGAQITPDVVPTMSGAFWQDPREAG